MSKLLWAVLHFLHFLQYCSITTLLSSTQIVVFQTKKNNFSSGRMLMFLKAAICILKELDSPFDQEYKSPLWFLHDEYINWVKYSTNLLYSSSSTQVAKFWRFSATVNCGLGFSLVLKYEEMTLRLKTVRFLCTCLQNKD